MEEPESKIDVNLLFWCIATNDDSAAFRTLFKYYYVPLCVYAKRYIEEKAIREDLVQDVFFSIWEKRKQLDINTSIQNYLVSCVKNNCLNYLRRSNLFEKYQTEIVERGTAYYEDSNSLYTLNELKELLNNVLKRLPKEYRIAFVMSRMHDKNNAEIAEILKVSVRTVERYKKRALEIIKEELIDFL